MHEDRDACVRAVRSRDSRFDGWFTTAVVTTGIYCRPSCPAMTPRARNMRFFATPAAAQRAGFRACKRCRPDASPGSPEWSVRADLTARAMRLIADGVIDREGVPGLASRLGYSTRQVERILSAELGAEPIALARAQRAQTARILVESTTLPMSEIAFAAGFASVRSFNDTVRQVFAQSPSDLRRRRRASLAQDGTEGSLDGRIGPGSSWHHVALRLAVREPFAPGSALAHLVRTAVPGVEEWRDGAFRRTLRLPQGAGIIALRPAGDHVSARVWLQDLRDLTGAVSRARALLDLDADPVAVDGHLGDDIHLGGRVRATPGIRVPRSVEAAELAVRAVLGQQVSTAAAARTAGLIAERAGAPVVDPAGGLTRLFPTPGAIAALSARDLRMPATRRRTVQHLAVALAEGELDLGPGCDRGAARAALSEIPGIGPWTVEMTALRGLGEPDAFPPTDLGVRRGLAELGLSGADEVAEAWRPWRAYATAHLWASSEPDIAAVLGAADDDPPRTGAA